MVDIISADKECSLEKSMESYQIEAISYSEAVGLQRGESWDAGLFIPLVCAGLKPGASIVSTKVCKEDISQMFLDIGLSHKIYMMEREEYGQYPQFYISSDETLLEEITVMEGNDAMGRFLGVPEKDNWWQVEEGTPENDEIMSIPEYLGIGEEARPDYKYAKLVSWICRPTHDGLARTIEIGKQWYEFAEQLEEDYDYSLAREIADKKMEERSVYYDVA